MKVPYSWLCDFAPFDSLVLREGSSAIPQDGIDLLVDSFNNLGLVVEGVERVGEGLDNVVVAQVLEINPIEGADKIRSVIVAAGEPDELEIVCGASNFAVGDKVPLARVGAVLPGGFAISKRRMRGIESHGMLCSAIELALGTDQSGLMILPGELPIGAPVAEALGIEPDVVFDLAIENNRPDANCIMGVARDLAAWLDLPFEEPAIPKLVKTERSSAKYLASTEVYCPEHCDRLLVAYFSDVTRPDLPAHVLRRLNLSGVRSVSGVVDISNYLMLELGQPSHPYDASELSGGTISVRLARKGEMLVTLDGVSRELGLADARGRESTDVVITDGSDSVVALAGIMGGSESEIRDSTVDVLVEMAHFAPMTISRTSKRMGLRSEASARFERGTDPKIIELALFRFCELLGADPLEIVDVSTPKATREAELTLRVPRVNEILGTALKGDEISRLLAPIGFETISVSEDSIAVRVPTNRSDVAREIDLIEEVARHYGYQKIDKVKPNSKSTGALKPIQRFRRDLCDLAVASGFYEIWGPTLLAPGEQEVYGDPGPFLKVDNPLAREESILRRSLLPGLVRTMRFNHNRKEKRLRFFEIGKVFSLEDGGIIERERAAFLLALPGDGAESAVALFARIRDMFSLKGVSITNTGSETGTDSPVPTGAGGFWGGLHPTRGARLAAGGAVVAMVGEVSPFALRPLGVDVSMRVGYIELDLDGIHSAKAPAALARPISPFPHAEIDLAFEVAEHVSAWEIEDALSSGEIDSIESVQLFDVYRGPSLAHGTRSLAYSIRLSAVDKTLSDSDIARERKRCIELVEQRYGAKLRG